MGRPKKDKNNFDDLPEEFKNALSGMKEQEIRQKISEIALDEEENTRTKQEDEDLKNLKEQVKLANEPYSDRSKMNKSKIRFARRVLEDQGKL